MKFWSHCLILSSAFLTIAQQARGESCELTLTEIDRNTEFELLISHENGESESFGGSISYQHVPNMMYVMQFWTGPSHVYSSRERDSLTLDFGRFYGKLEFFKKVNDYERVYKGQWDCKKAYKFAGRKGPNDQGENLQGLVFAANYPCSHVITAISMGWSRVYEANQHAFPGTCRLQVAFGEPGNDGSVTYEISGAYRDHFEGVYYKKGSAVNVDLGFLNPKKEHISEDLKTLQVPAFLYNHILTLNRL